MSIYITVGGVERSPLIDSLTISQALNQQTTCEMTFLVSDTWLPSVGAAVEVWHDLLLRYAGTIDTVDRRAAAPGAQFITITCLDHTAILGRRLAGEYSWVNVPAGQILEDIVNRSLTDEGLYTSGLQQGPVVKSWQTDYQTVAEAAQQLGEMAGYVFRITPDRVVRFHPPEQFDAPFQIGPSVAPVRSLEVAVTREQYANRVIARLEQALLEGLVDTFTAAGRSGDEDHGSDDPGMALDGNRKVFDLSLRMHRAPVIKVNGVAKTVREAGDELPADWYWYPQSQRIEQPNPEDPDNPPALAATDSLEVTYTAVARLVAQRQDAAAIAERQGAEGGSGIYEMRVDLADPISLDDAGDFAQATLDRRSELSHVAHYSTDTLLEPEAADLEPGLRQYIAWPALGASGYYLIRSVTIRDHKLASGVHLRLDVEAVKGPIVGDAVAFFRALAGTGGTPAGLVRGPADVEFPEPQIDPPALPVGVSLAIQVVSGRYVAVVAWTPPASPGGTVGYVVQLRFAEDASGNVIEAEWGAENGVEGVASDSHIYAPQPLPAEVRYAKPRVAARNAYGDLTAWVEGPAWVKIQAAQTPGVFTPDRLGSGDFSLVLGPTQLHEQTKAQTIRVDVTITARPANVTHFNIFTYIGPSSPTSNQWLTPYSQGLAPSGNTTDEFWVTPGAAAQTLWVAVEPATEQVTMQPGTGSVIKSLTIPAITAPLQVAGFSVGVSYQTIGGIQYGAFSAAATGVPADPNRAHFSIERAQANAGGAVIGGWNEVFGPPSLPFQQDRFEWARPVLEYWQFRLYAVGFDGRKTLASPSTFFVALSGGGTIAGSAVTNIPAASMAAGLSVPGNVNAVPNGNGELIISKTQDIVYNQYDRKTYRWDTDRYKRRAGPGDLEPDSVIAGSVAAAVVGTRELTTQELLMGAGGGKPVRLRVNDAFGNMIAFLGDNQDGFVGGWFQRARIGGTYGSPVIDASSAGMSITNAALAVNGSGFNAAINTADGLKVTSTGTWSGAFTQLKSHELVNEYAIGAQYRFKAWAQSAELTHDGAMQARLANNGPGGALQLAHPNSSANLFLNAQSGENRIFTARAGSYIHFSGTNSYSDFREYRQNSNVRIDASGNLRWPNVYYESNPLAGLTANQWVPVYDGSGNYRGKILIVP